MFRSRASLLLPSGEGTSYKPSSLCQTSTLRQRSTLCSRQSRVWVNAEYSRDPRAMGTGPATAREPWRNVGAYDRPPVLNGPPRSAMPPPGGPPPPPTPQPEDPRPGNSLTRALVAAAFITGVGAGVYFDSNITLSPTNVASTEIVDRRTPNSELCMAYGYSAMALDQRIFVSFNPFNVYVSQPEVKPGCVLRRSNFNVLENKKLVSNTEVDNCKRSMNTFAFVGDLEDNPQINCVYHSEEAENQFLLNPKNVGVLGGSPPSPSSAEPSSPEHGCFSGL